MGLNPAREVSHMHFTENLLPTKITIAMRSSAQAGSHVGIDEVVRRTDKPDDVANKDPEMRMWDVLDAGTHQSDTMADAMAEHMQARAHALQPAVPPGLN